MKTVEFNVKVKKKENKLPNRMFQIDPEGRNNMPKRGKSELNSLFKKYKITNELLSKWFGYSSADSFIHSSGKHKIIDGLEEVIQYIEEQLKDKTVI